MECDEGTFDHIAGGLSGNITIDLDESDEIDDVGQDAHGNSVASTPVHSGKGDCEFVVCTGGDARTDVDSQHADEFESPASMLDNDNGSGSNNGNDDGDGDSDNDDSVIHQHGQPDDINDPPASVLQLPSGGDGDAAAGPHLHDDTNDDNDMSSASGSDFDDLGFDRLGYHFCSDCIQCGRCESCGYVLRMRRTIYLPAPSLGHSCIFYRLGRHQCTACWVTGICDVCNDTLRDYRPGHEFSD